VLTKNNEEVSKPIRQNGKIRGDGRGNIDARQFAFKDERGGLGRGTIAAG
jgi:hypothetical protein